MNLEPCIYLDFSPLSVDLSLWDFFCMTEAKTLLCEVVKLLQDRVFSMVASKCLEMTLRLQVKQRKVLASRKAPFKFLSQGINGFLLDFHYIVID